MPKPSLLLGQNLSDFVQVAREVVHQVVPHLRLVFVLLVALPSPLGDGELPAAFEHEGNSAFGYPHFGRGLCRSRLELLYTKLERLYW